MDKIKKKKLKVFFIVVAVIAFTAVAVFCCRSGYWAFNKPNMSAVETTARYCTYFDKGNSVGVNSLHYNFGKKGFYMSYFDTVQYRNKYRFIDGEDLGKVIKTAVNNETASEALSNSSDYTVVKAQIETSQGEKKVKIIRYFVLVKMKENSRWRVCFVG